MDSAVVWLGGDDNGRPVIMRMLALAVLAALALAGCGSSAPYGSDADGGASPTSCSGATGGGC